MSHRGTFLRACLFGAALSFTAGLAGTAQADDPWAGDAIGLPPDLNIALFYNVFNASGDFGPPHGSNITDHSKLAVDVPIFRYVHTWGIDGVTVGAQVVLPINLFLSGTEVGGAHLTVQSGFQQPLLGAFAFPINDNADGRSVAVGGWIYPPISSFNKNDIVNPSENLTTYEVEAGFHQILAGDPKGSNLALEGWGEAYFYSDNTSVLAGYAGGPSATLREEPTEEGRVYLPYVISPATQLFIAPGFYQDFGGKQTWKVHANGAVIDTGNRTDESQLRFFAGMFLSPTVQVEGLGTYDVAAHGGFLARSFQIRFLKFF
jgi:hypothetical protein